MLKFFKIKRLEKQQAKRGVLANVEAYDLVFTNQDVDKNAIVNAMYAAFTSGNVFELYALIYKAKPNSEYENCSDLHCAFDDVSNFSAKFYALSA